MGIEIVATLAYGVKITNEELANKIIEGEVELEGDFESVWAGSCYGHYMGHFICIKKSVIDSFLDDNHKSPIKPEKLVAKPDWDKQLLSWCKENGQEKPKIGWWLCCLES